ncbi:hypothetical protein H6P81_008578 [Aristolochia fimbriata]|uniref:GDSL esterase/lipase n=1 Tax=Aristolochia fimbriata TaxID=158543 RepID=A0AAV7EIF9_ARIFI|nr:hypothetical protein H6P81_008578 [Aristolochia fimbriata]
MKGGSAVFVAVLVFLADQFSSAISLGKPRVPAIYIFGDSISDDGNNNGLNIDPRQAKANYPPYGVDLEAGPTGRFTNGKNFVDFIAEKLGLPLAPAYLSLGKEKRQKIATGLNYASGSAGILPETGSALGERVPLDKQIDHFQTTVEEDLLPQFSSKAAVQDHLGRSTIFIDIGGNDLLNNWIQQKPEYNRSKNYPRVPDYVHLLMETLQAQIKRIYDLGGRRFLVFGLAPIGCIPIVTHEGAPCEETWNSMAREFNNQLAPLTQRLQSRLHGSVFALGLTYDLILDFHRNPSRYGFKSVNQPCCVVNSTAPTLCVPGTAPCANRKEYLYYDMFHCTSKTAKIVAHSCFHRGPGSVCPPTAIKKLVSKH